MKINITFQVRKELEDRDADLTATRVLQRYPGFAWVNYKGRKYPLNGGIRNPHFIDISRPL